MEQHTSWTQTANGRMNVNDELEKLFKEVVIEYSEVLLNIFMEGMKNTTCTFADAHKTVIISSLHPRSRTELATYQI